MNIKDVSPSLIGKTVTWESVSSGVTKQKTGKVVAFVKAGQWPKTVIRKDTSLSGYTTNRSMPNPGMSRYHNSVLVAVDGRLYWPRVKNIEVVDA